MKIVTAAEMREIDRVTTETYGVPSLTLMENAGAAVAERVFELWASAVENRVGTPAPKTRAGATLRVLVLCGKGNNGGDGFVAARILHERGHKVAVILLADPSDLKGDAAVMYRKLPVSAIVVRSNEELKSEHVQSALSADVYIDAILGTGFKPPVGGLYAEAIAEINANHAPVLAVDIPSGADADAMIPQNGMHARANAIVTFTAPRPAHVFNVLTHGTTSIVDIGSPDDAIISCLQLNVSVSGEFAAFVAPRPPESNKGSYGHVLVIGGSLGKAGAAAMAGMAALRAGAGLSTVATAESVLPTVAGFYPELMTVPLPETDAGTIATSAGVELEALLKGMTVVAIGPGISRDPHTATLVRSLVAHVTIPMVVDADGLNAFEHHTNELSGKARTLVITPHPGEMARLAGCTTAEVQKDRLGVARKFAQEHELIVVLKGHRTLVVQPDQEAWVNVTGNAGMATGGTGDILTGMVAGMIAQHPRDAMKATCAAVYLHGLAGDLARSAMGEHSLIGTDLLEKLPSAFERTRQESASRRAVWGNSNSMLSS